MYINIVCVYKTAEHGLGDIMVLGYFVSFRILLRSQYGLSKGGFFFFFYFSLETKL